MRNKRSPWFLIIFLLFGALIGGFVGQLLSQYPYFAWMSLGGANGYRHLFSFSLDPAFDFHVIRLGFNMVLRINVGSIIGMILGVLIFMKI